MCHRAGAAAGGPRSPGRQVGRRVFASQGFRSARLMAVSSLWNGTDIAVAWPWKGLCMLYAMAMERSMDRVFRHSWCCISPKWLRMGGGDDTLVLLPGVWDLGSKKGPRALPEKIPSAVCTGRMPLSLPLSKTVTSSPAKRSRVGHHDQLVFAPLRRFSFFSSTRMFSGSLVPPLEKGMMWSNS
jgi:hypothetical protein